MRRTLNKVMLLMIVLVMSTATIVLANDNVTFVLHNIGYYDSEYVPDFERNSGFIRDIGDGMFGINDAQFAIFSVTDLVKADGREYDEIAQDVLNTPSEELLKFAEENADYIDTITTKTVDDEFGIASITVNPNDYGENNQAFLFIEVYTPTLDFDAEIVNKAAPMLVILPVDNIEKPGTFLSIIHLYPKNYGIEGGEDGESQRNPDDLDPNKPPTGIGSNELLYTSAIIGFGLILIINVRKKHRKINSGGE